MGRNIALNASRRGFPVVVFNPKVDGEKDLLSDFLKENVCDTIEGAEDPVNFVGLVPRPRVILLMLKAGKPVDDVIGLLSARLSAGDIVIDGGNSHYSETAKRLDLLEGKGILYVGCGVSGGASGALNGPSLMPGGSPAAWDAVRPLLQSIAARLDDGTPCCEWMGPGGSGHFVKMVHNGIEYAVMQAIAESYDMMRRMIGMSAEKISEIFAEWNSGVLGGYLMGIIPRVLGRRDGTGLLIDSILDRAFQKGSGRDAATAAFDLGVPAPAIDEAVSSRLISALPDERRRISGRYPAVRKFTGETGELLQDIGDALYCSMAVSHAQGFAVMGKASIEFGWNLDLGAVARIWRGGCVIQSVMMKDFESLFARGAGAADILAEMPFAGAIGKRLDGWRGSVSAAVLHGIPVPVTSSSLAFFDGLRSETLPANLIQAMRDFFGAHGYERNDSPAGMIFRTEWEG